MNFKDLSKIFRGLNARGPVEVEFINMVCDLECYPEPGMRATIISILDDTDPDVFKVMVDYEKYDEFNKAFEARNYFNKEGKPVLTAREAGYYSKQETIYVSASDNIEKYMCILSTQSSELFDAYIKEASNVSYTLWLENKIAGSVLH